MKTTIFHNVLMSFSERSSAARHFYSHIGLATILILTSSLPQCIFAQTSQGTLIAVNQADSNISIVDLNAVKEVARVPEGVVAGHEVAASLDGKIAYVPIYGDSSVGDAGTDGRELLAIDLASHKIVGRLDFGHGVRPHCIVMNPRDGLLYVTTEVDQTVTIIDPKLLKIVGYIPTGQDQSHMLVLSHDGRFGYTANVGPGTVSVLDLKARKLLSVIKVSGNVQRISITPDDRTVFTADQTSPRLAAIDTTTNTIKQWISLPAVAYGTGTTQDGRWLLVSLPNSYGVAVVDLYTQQIVRTISVPKGPHEVVITPDNRTAYVACMKSGYVAMINLSDWSIKGLIKVGNNADGIGWASSQQVN
ncbi:YncE family protein [Granulicella arctica]|uniref:YncE family protein n=1 Tax=Granulicella arctica TaxID=940613 RepID=UPI0021E0A047|nr:cytochrome D1 domain-containing protein [Granulicella arctica]